MLGPKARAGGALSSVSAYDEHPRKSGAAAIVMATVHEVFIVSPVRVLAPVSNARAGRFASTDRVGGVVCRAMEVTVNGASRQVPDGLTVRALVEHLGLTDGPVAVEINRAIVPRAQHAVHPVAPGDVIEIVHFVGGG
jgi:sulfur carrier protein